MSLPAKCPSPVTPHPCLTLAHSCTQVDTYLPFVNRTEVLIQFENGTELKGSFFPKQATLTQGAPSRAGAVSLH